jgi:hypothetical protein
MFLNLGMILAFHGKEKEGKHNFFISLFSFLLVTWILYMAGCFNQFIQ